MTPLFLVAAGILVAGQKQKSSRTRKKKEEPRGVARVAAARGGISAAARKGAGKRGPRPAYARKGNGRIKHHWTSFPWDPMRVSEVAGELLAKGEANADNLTLAVAKTIYPVHPISGMAFEWPPTKEGPERDVGAQMMWDRIRLRVNTLVAADEERQADEATVHAQAEAQEDAERASAPASTDGEAETGEDEPEAPQEEPEADEPEDDEPEDDEPSSPVVGRATMAPMADPYPVPQAPPRRRLTLTRKRTMQRRPQVDVYALHPEDNQIADGLFHTVQGGETIGNIARAALEVHLPGPTDEQVAQYVSLLVCSPANDLPTVWDNEHNMPGAAPYPWGATRPTLWLPKLNEQKLHDGIVTTLGVTWPDGSNGITPPPEMIARD